MRVYLLLVGPTGPGVNHFFFAQQQMRAFFTQRSFWPCGWVLNVLPTNFPLTAWFSVVFLIGSIDGATRIGFEDLLQ